MSAPLKTMSVFVLVMLITGAVDGVRNLPSVALYGTHLIFFFVVGALLFLIPTGFISAELCKQTQKEGGIYPWTKLVLGPKFGVLAIWLQWINTMAWFPTCLTGLIGTFTYVVNPAWATHPWYLVSTSVLIFWSMTLLSLGGVHQSAKVASLAVTFGLIVPMILIITLCVLWLVFGKPLAIHFTAHNWLPSLNNLDGWNALTAIITSFLGMELATVHVNKIKNATTIFPKALTFSVILIILTMGFGSLGVAFVVPSDSIQLVSGTIQAFDMLFAAFHMPWMGVVLAIMIVFGSLGAMTNWLISPANGLLQVAKDGYLPKWLAKENGQGCPQNMLLLQAVVVTIVSGFFFLLPSVNGGYWFLMDLSTELYVFMYLLMFIVSAFFFVKAKKILFIPGGKKGAMALSFLGMAGCLITAVVGFLPPTGINVGSGLHYISLFTFGLFLMLLPICALYLYKAYRHRA